MISESDKDHGVSVRAAIHHAQQKINDAEKAGLTVTLDVFKRSTFGVGDCTVIESKIERRESV